MRVSLMSQSISLRTPILKFASGCGCVRCPYKVLRTRWGPISRLLLITVYCLESCFRSYIALNVVHPPALLQVVSVSMVPSRVAQFVEVSLNNILYVLSSLHILHLFFIAVSSFFSLLCSTPRHLFYSLSFFFPQL